MSCLEQKGVVSCLKQEGDYACFPAAIRNFVIQQHGQKVWKNILTKSKIPESVFRTGEYNENTLQKLLDAIVLESAFLDKEKVLEQFGSFFLHFLRKSGHDEVLRTLGNNLLKFIENLDYLHGSYFSNEFPNGDPPSYRPDPNSSPENIILHFYSHLHGFQSFVKGFLCEIAYIYFDKRIDTKVVSIDVETVGRQNKKQHTVFTLDTNYKIDESEDIPTFVAQTKKHAEHQINKRDLELVRRRIEEIRRSLGEEYLPLSKAKSTKSKWKMLFRIHKLFRGFSPTFPERIQIDPKTFVNAFPYHVVFDVDLSLKQVGFQIQKLMPKTTKPLSKVSDAFEITYPRCLEFTIETIRKFICSPFTLTARRNHVHERYATEITHLETMSAESDFKSKLHNRFKRAVTTRPLLVIHGEMIWMEDNSCMLFLGSPKIDSLNDLENRGMRMSDISMHDVTRRMLLTNGVSANGDDDVTRSAALEIFDKNKNAEKGETDFGTDYDFKDIDINDIDFDTENDLDKLRFIVKHQQRALREQRRKTEDVMYSLLPDSAALRLKDGASHEAGLYKNVTLLFCDFVMFTQMCERVDPSLIIDLINILNSQFDSLCNIHGVFRVESIGDAYLVASGIPDPVKSHAERVCNVALGMMKLANEVTSPVTSEGLPIRIGIHSGDVIGGVVGCKIPRYNVFGKTVTVTSQMESHGQKNRIHISHNTYKEVHKRGFTVESRGKTNLRSIGPVETYFLVRNENLTADEIIGRNDTNRSSQLHQTAARYNKIHPQFTVETTNAMAEFKYRD
ncbi:guanylate cyclase soluble subunit beta-2-like [Tubulanus polymorphus]|uniref:guanylate cyclase soluble subunit beta-2-like n=1 Tax=Tubulanus polymorphus TaxID=672921 RepID=UPI003DA5CA7C